MKVNFHDRYKNIFPSLMKEGKQVFYTKYCWKYITKIYFKNTWKGIKTIVSTKNVTSTIPQSIE